MCNGKLFEIETKAKDTGLLYDAKELRICSLRKAVTENTCVRFALSVCYNDHFGECVEDELEWDQHRCTDILVVYCEMNPGKR